MFHARDVSTWLSALILVTSASGCSLEDRAASRFVVPTLRDNGQVLATRVRARSATFGPWTVRRVTGESGDESVVPRASFETGAPGAPVQHDTVRFTLERVEDGDAFPVALVSCDAARRRGLDADLASVGEDPGGEVAIRCDAAMEGRAFSLRAEGRSLRKSSGQLASNTAARGRAPPGRHRAGGGIPTPHPATARSRCCSITACGRRYPCARRLQWFNSTTRSPARCRMADAPSPPPSLAVGVPRGCIEISRISRRRSPPRGSAPSCCSTFRGSRRPDLKRRAPPRAARRAEPLLHATTGRSNHVTPSKRPVGLACRWARLLSLAGSPGRCAPRPGQLNGDDSCNLVLSSATFCSPPW